MDDLVKDILSQVFDEIFQQKNQSNQQQIICNDRLNDKLKVILWKESVQ